MRVKEIDNNEGVVIIEDIENEKTYKMSGTIIFTDDNDDYFEKADNSYGFWRNFKTEGLMKHSPDQFVLYNGDVYSVSIGDHNNIARSVDDLPPEDFGEVYAYFYLIEDDFKDIPPEEWDLKRKATYIENNSEYITLVRES